jgi:hypothetical protein
MIGFAGRGATLQCRSKKIGLFCHGQTTAHFVSAPQCLHTRTPLKFAALRVTLTVALGYLFALPLPHLLSFDQRWGAAGLTLSAGIAGWLESVLLRRALHFCDRYFCLLRPRKDALLHE